MMAKIIDPVKVDETDTSPVLEESDSTQNEVQEKVAELPEQYRDKSPADLIKMHQELENKLGEQGSELGKLRSAETEVKELRRVVDDFVLKQSTAKEEPAEEADFFADPDKAVAEKIANHPAIKEAQQTTQQIKQDQARQQLMEKHPDVGDIIKDTGFVDWVKGDPIRIELLQRADSQFDTAAADNLLGQWKQIKQVSESATSSEKVASKETLKKVSTGGAKGSSEPPSRKIFRRADIINLMKTDIKRYQGMEPEIRKAYAEGRVR